MEEGEVVGGVLMITVVSVRRFSPLAPRVRLQIEKEKERQVERCENRERTEGRRPEERAERQVEEQTCASV